MVPLVFGDPRGEKDAAGKALVEGGDGVFCACFLFPSACHFIRDPYPAQNEPCYVPLRKSDAEWQQRRRHFARETADALFERARGFRVPTDEWEKERPEWQHPRRFKAALHSGELDVEPTPPALTLFEWRSDRAKNSAADPFQSGFLLPQAHFPADQPNPPTLEDRMLFNERFCFWYSHLQPLNSVSTGLGSVLRKLLRVHQTPPPALRLGESVINVSPGTPEQLFPVCSERYQKRFSAT